MCERVPPLPRETSPDGFSNGTLFISREREAPAGDGGRGMAGDRGRKGGKGMGSRNKKGAGKKGGKKKGRR